MSASPTESKFTVFFFLFKLVFLQHQGKVAKEMKVAIFNTVFTEIQRTKTVLAQINAGQINNANRAINTNKTACNLATV